MRALKSWLPPIAWAAVIITASSDSFSSHQTHHWIQTIFGRPVPELVNEVIRKASHVIEYSILAALVWRADRRLAVGIACALAVASTDELRQSFTLYRGGSPWDVVLDVSAATLALLLLNRFATPAPAPAPNAPQ